jgi:hypothetical protein
MVFMGALKTSQGRVILSAKHPKGIYRKLLFKIDSGFSIEEVESMLVGQQFKEPQSELTRGSHTAKNYHRWFEKKTN